MKRNALIIGFGVSGRSAAELLLQKGWNVVAVDKEAEALTQKLEVQHLIELGVPLISDRACFELSSFHLVILSPGIHPDHPLVAKAKALSIECIGEAELAFKHLHHKVIGITGTNGKTTVTLLVEHALQKAGVKAVALGNVGTPLASQVTVLPDSAVVVAELSSFQLETLQTKCLSSGLLLNITPDHLDRYAGMKEYAKAKVKMGSLLKSEGRFYVFEECYQTFQDLFEGLPVSLFGYQKGLYLWTDLHSLFRKEERIGALPEELKGRKNHDLENFMGAFLLCEREGVSYDVFVDATASFVKPRHRLEFVKEVRGVSFFDDSKGTNVDAVVRAVEAMKTPVYLIAGGVHKGASYAPWLPYFEGRVKGIFAIGEAAGQIENELGSEIPVCLCMTLEEAVEKSFAAAATGEAVLLSPGCSSFDMFKDYVHRGEEFVRVVNRL